MKILVVSSFLPHPLFSGGHVRLFNILKELSKKHELTLVCEIRDHQTEEDIKQVKKFCKQIVVFQRKKQWSFSNVVNAGFSFYPFLMIGHKNDKMKSKIGELLSENKFDIIHVETFYVMQNLPDNVSIPVVLIEHNIEHLVYERYAKQAPFFIRPLLFLDIVKLQYWERFFWRKATKLVAVSQEEKILMNREDVEIVPNGVDLQKFKVQTSKLKVKNSEKRILFIGDFKWIQNRDSVEWILKEIWPKIDLKLTTKNLKLWIVGRKIPRSIRELTNDPDVFFDENAPKDTEKIFDQADILLAPIRIGGGTSYKILESMASGVPVVTTYLGKEGIEGTDKKEILIADTAEDIANVIVLLLKNEGQYKDITQNARKMIEDRYDWKEIVKKLEQVYESTIR